MSDIRTLLETFKRLDEKVAEFKVKDNGKADNFNIPKELKQGPYIEVTQPSGKVRRYYGSVENLEKYKSSNSRAKDAEIVDPNAKEPAPQTSAELDADSADSGTPPGTNITQADIDAQGAAAADAGMNNKAPEPSADDVDSADSGTPSKDDSALALSDGSKFRNSKVSKRELNKVWGKKYKRYQELLKKMNESVPVSLKGYLKEYSINLLEALTDAEKQELQNLYKDLNSIAGSGLVSGANAKLIQRGIASAPDEVKNPTASSPDTAQADIDAQGAAAAQAGADTTQADIDAQGAAAAQAGADTTQAEPEAEPEAEPARDPSGSLDAFSKAGQGGLANNPEETAAIKELQTELQALGFDPKGIDGKYGPGTVAAVKAFQTSKGLTADGDAGPDTIGAILRAEPEPKTNEPAAGGEGEELLKQIKALLDKASIKPDVTSTADSPIAASIDFTSAIGKGIYESVNLREALSSEDQMKLQGLLNKLNKNHPELAKQNAKLFKQAQTFIKTGKVAAPGAAPKGKVAGPSGGTLPNSDARGQKPNVPSGGTTSTTTKTSSTKATSGKPQSGTFISRGPTGWEKEPGKTTTKTSTDATMKGVVITSAIRKTPEWKQFYKKPVAPKPSLEQAAIRKADLKYKQAIAQGKIKPPKGASVDSTTTTKNPDGSTTTTTVGKGQNSPTVKSVRDEFAKMDREEQEKQYAKMKPGGKVHMSKGDIETDF